MSDRLIKCNVCGKDIADKATKCPHCGATTSFSKKNYKLVVIIIIVAIIVFSIIGYFNAQHAARIQFIRSF